MSFKKKNQIKSFHVLESRVQLKNICLDNLYVVIWKNNKYFIIIKYSCGLFVLKTLHISFLYNTSQSNY